MEWKVAESSLASENIVPIPMRNRRRTMLIKMLQTPESEGTKSFAYGEEML